MFPFNNYKKITINSQSGVVYTSPVPFAVFAAVTQDSGGSGSAAITSNVRLTNTNNSSLYRYSFTPGDGDGSRPSVTISDGYGLKIGEAGTSISITGDTYTGTFYIFELGSI